MFKDLKDNVGWMLHYGDIQTHIKHCFYYNDYYIFPINWLPKDGRYFGFHFQWYDGPHYSFGLWLFNISSSPCEMPEIVKPEPIPNSIQFIKDNYLKSKIKHIKNNLAKLKKDK